MERVSPTLTILRIPDELILEVRASGPYSSIEWRRNGVAGGLNSFLLNFDEILRLPTTTANDLGVFQVALNSTISGQARLTLEFIVIEPGIFRVCIHTC